jgi:hypothetical protein
MIKYKENKRQTKARTVHFIRKMKENNERIELIMFSNVINRTLFCTIYDSAQTY